MLSFRFFTYIIQGKIRYTLFLCCSLFLLTLVGACKKNTTLSSTTEERVTATPPTKEALAQPESNVADVLKKIDLVPTRELVTFPSVQDKRFLNDYIIAFDLVYDAQNQTYAAENVRPLLFVLNNNSNTDYITKVKPYLENAMKYFNLKIDVEPSLFPDMSLWEYAATSFQSEQQNIGKGKYVIICKGGSLDGKVVVESGEIAAGKATRECIKAGGCAQVCRQQAYMISGSVLQQYGDFTKDEPVLKTILASLEDDIKENDMGAIIRSLEVYNVEDHSGLTTDALKKEMNISWHR